MKRTILWATITVFLLCGYGLTQQADPPLPATVLGPPLVAWSELQTPQPVLQPATRDENSSGRHQREQAPGSQAQSQSSTQFLIGTILNDGSQYILKTLEGAAYEIDDQHKARVHAGRQVRIAGWIDAKRSVLHVSALELLSGQS